jgi:hypothetical protein
VAEIHIPEPIPAEQAAVCSSSFRVGSVGRLIEKGTRLRLTDPIVRRFPEYFTTAPIPLVQLKKAE